MISRMVDVVMIRTFEQSIIERFAAHSRVPVINGLTNEFHPCQILADIYTYVEHRGSIAGRPSRGSATATTSAYTWLQAAAILGFSVHVSTPPGYELTRRRRAAARRAPLRGRSPIRCEACRGADLVTTDVWTSMGFEAENEARAARVRRLPGRRRDDGAWPGPTRCSCTACPRTAARKSPPR